MVGDNLKGLAGGLGAAAQDRQFRTLLRLMAFLVAVSTVFYRFVEGWRILDAMYFSVITLATIGYGDLAPKTDAGKIFTMVYAIVGIGIFVALVSTLAEIVIAERRGRFARRKLMRGRKGGRYGPAVSGEEAE